MITKESFFNALQEQRNFTEQLDNLYALGIDMLDSKISTSFYKVFNLYLTSNFNAEGIDWISWYLYEKPNLEGDNAWDAYGNPIAMNTDEDLWELVKDYLR